jgi:hypothetical protein
MVAPCPTVRRRHSDSIYRLQLILWMLQTLMYVRQRRMSRDDTTDVVVARERPWTPPHTPAARKLVYHLATPYCVARSDHDRLRFFRADDRRN